MNQSTPAYIVGDNINDLYQRFTNARNQPHPQNNFSPSSYSKKMYWKQTRKKQDFCKVSRKCTVMQIEKALKNDILRVSKVS